MKSFFDNKNKYLEEIKKACEIGLLKYQFLYSTVLERPLILEDFDVFIDEKNKLGSYIFRYLYSRIYLNLTHEEQKYIIKNSIKHNNKINKNIDEIFNNIIKEYNNIEEKIFECKDEKEIFNLIGVFFNHVLNIVKDIVYKNIDNIPAELFKKIFLNLLRDDIDVTQFFDIYFEESKRILDENIDRLSKLSFDELKLKMDKSLEMSDMKSYMILVEAIIRKEQNDLDK